MAAAGCPSPKITDRIRVTELGQAGPQVLVIDVDFLQGRSFETLRQLRFVLPRCTIAVFTGTLLRAWVAECHLGGANCLLAKTSDGSTLAAGLRHARSFGSFTDPAFQS